MRNRSRIRGAHRLNAAAVLAACVALGASQAKAQALTVLPVNIELAPGQMTSTLTIINNGDAATSIQVRALVWDQADGTEHLGPSDDVAVSPPIATMAPGATQIVRLVLRRAPQGQETSYRILLDQILPPAAPGTVRLALRLSIPVFAQPPTRAVPHIQYHVETDSGRLYLVAVNDGTRHDTIRNVVLTAANGSVLKTAAGASPYILAKTTRRWAITPQGAAPAAGSSLHLTGMSTTGAVDVPVPVVGHP